MLEIIIGITLLALVISRVLWLIYQWINKSTNDDRVEKTRNHYNKKYIRHIHKNRRTSPSSPPYICYIGTE